jgi:hypothetical protein
MNFLGEIVAQGLLEGIAYFVGKAIAFVFLPHLGIEPLKRQKSMPSSWKWRGLTYTKGGKRYLYTESIELIGVITLLLVGFGALAMARYAK